MNVLKMLKEEFKHFVEEFGGNNNVAVLRIRVSLSGYGKRECGCNPICCVVSSSW